MYYVKERIEVISTELKQQYLRNKIVLKDWQVKPGNFINPQDAAESGVQWEAFHTDRDFWYGPDKHYWFKVSYTIPEEQAECPLWLSLHTQIDEWDDGKNPQFLLFINGHPVQGLDMNHREVLLTDCAKKGDVYEIQFSAYTGTLHSDFRLFAMISELVKPVYDLYYDIVVPLRAFGRLNKESKERLALERILNDTINLIDFRAVYSDAYFASIDSASKYIGKALYTDLAGSSDVIASCIGHTHIDVAWWWTVAQTREKVARSFSTVLKLMEEYPNYKFMSSTPQIYAFLKERYPELYEKIKERVREGRWEPEGGMWLEADCNLTSGESLVRQFLYGKTFFKEEFGVDNRLLWLPDVFGYSAALPQICKKSGIDYFMTTKISWNQFNKMPCDTFNWRGIDGTEILTHFISTLDVGQSHERFITTYNGKLHPDAIMGAWERYQQKDLDNDILIAYGYGDGGGGPTRDMLETSKRMEKGINGIPRVRQVFAGQYFKELEARVKDNKRLPRWVGELYFEYHRGTYTSMARNKRANRKSELMMMDLELLSVLSMDQLQYPKTEMDDMWRTILLNQFHDILPGTSIHEVYEVTKKEYEEIAEAGAKLIWERLETLAGDEAGVVLFNTLGFDRDDIVPVCVNEGEALVDESGHVYPAQKTEKGMISFVRNVPAKGYKGFGVIPAQACESPFDIADNSIETPFYSVQFNEDGRISCFYDKTARRSVLKEGSQGNLFRMYEDKPMYYDNWDIDVYYTEKSWDIGAPSTVKWIEKGPVRATLQLEYSFSNSKLAQDIHFYAESPRIDFETWVDWHESQHLLKVLFPLDLNTDEATFDIQFGNVKRKIHQNTSWDKARFESCAQKWIDVSEGGFGVSLMNDCKYGHSVIDGVMGLTLIKSGIEPNPVTDQEEHFFTYSLYPHTGDWKNANTPLHAMCLNQPMYSMKGDKALDFSYAKASHENVIIETIKRSEDDNAVILRVYENQNARTNAQITLGVKPKEVFECDLMENAERPVSLENGSISFDIKPYEIKSFKLVF